MSIPSHVVSPSDIRICRVWLKAAVFTFCIRLSIQFLLFQNNEFRRVAAVLRQLGFNSGYRHPASSAACVSLGLDPRSSFYTVLEIAIR